MLTTKVRERVVSLLFFALLFVLTDRLLVFCIEPVDYSWFFNHILEKTGGEDEKIDMVIIGASRGQRSYDPEIFEEVLGLDSVFNASSGFQLIESSYFQLKEILERYHPRYVLFDWTWNRLYERDSLQSRLINLGRIHGRNKLDYVRETFRTSELLRVISGAYNDRGFFVPSHIRKTLAEKMTLIKNNYAECIAGPDLYTDKGFVYSSRSEAVMDRPEDSFFTADKIDPRAMAYLDRIVDLCNAHGAQLFLVASPTSLMSLYHTPNYQTAVDYYSEYARERGIIYHDLNLLKGRAEWLSDEDMMYDEGHVCGEGAERVSRRYAQIMKETLTGQAVDKYFYDDVDKLWADIEGFISVGAQISIQDRIAYVRLSSVYSDGIVPEYKIEISQNGSDYQTVMDWSTAADSEFYVTDYTGSAFFRVTVRDEASHRSMTRVIEKVL